VTTSRKITHIAAKAADLKSKSDITLEEIRELGASALSQSQDDPATRGKRRLHYPSMEEKKERLKGQKSP
jgi:hypothetical protein